MTASVPLAGVGRAGRRHARRAVVRWSVRMARREWRSRILLIVLLALAVMAAVGQGVAAFSLLPAEGESEFGDATHILTLENATPESIGVDVAAADEWFEQVEPVGRRQVSLPGIFRPLELRAQDIHGQLGASMLALVEGREPRVTGEAAVTDDLAAMLDAQVGERLRLDDDEWSVVGLVENPGNLTDEFVLLSPAELYGSDALTLLVRDDDGRVGGFRPPSESPMVTAGRPSLEATWSAAATLAITALVLGVVAMVSAAAYMVIIRRRLRDLAMFAAIGGTERHIRLAVVADGILSGLVATVIGVGVALSAWIAGARRLEPVVGHRIDPLEIPWWLVAVTAGLAIATSAGAAWWPARTVARIPIVAGLSGRPPERDLDTPRTRLALLVPAGMVCIAWGSQPFGSVIDGLILLIGIAAVIAGSVAVAPLAMRIVARTASRRSVGLRVALRDLDRYRMRAGAALGAVTVTIGVAISIVLITSANLYSSEAEGNLSSSQMLVRVGEIPSAGDVAPIPDRAGDEIERLDQAVADIVEVVGADDAIPIDVAVVPDMDGFGGVPAVVLAEEIPADRGRLHRVLTELYVANDEVLALYNLELDAIDPSIDVLTAEEGELWYQPVEPELVRNVRHIDERYDSLPSSFITPAALAERGWNAARASWLVTAAQPLMSDQLAAAQQLAAGAGMTVESRHQQADLASLRRWSVLVGGTLALGIASAAVGLIRADSDNELRALTAVGATSRVRRSVMAATAGALTGLGALLGVIAAYASFGAAFIGDLSRLWPIPFGHVALVMTAVPAVAVLVGWVLAGSEPHAVARRPIE